MDTFSSFLKQNLDSDDLCPILFFIFYVLSQKLADRGFSFIPLLTPHCFHLQIRYSLNSENKSKSKSKLKRSYFGGDGSILVLIENCEGFLKCGQLVRRQRFQNFATVCFSKSRHRGHTNLVCFQRRNDCKTILI